MQKKTFGICSGLGLFLCFSSWTTLLFRTNKKAFYDKLDLRLLTDNKTFWKTAKSLFSDKHISHKKIILLEGEKLLQIQKKSLRP